MDNDKVRVLDAEGDEDRAESEDEEDGGVTMTDGAANKPRVPGPSASSAALASSSLARSCFRFSSSSDVSTIIATPHCSLFSFLLLRVCPTGCETRMTLLDNGSIPGGPGETETAEPAAPVKGSLPLPFSEALSLLSPELRTGRRILVPDEPPRGSIFPSPLPSRSPQKDGALLSALAEDDGEEKMDASTGADDKEDDEANEDGDVKETTKEEEECPGVSEEDGDDEEDEAIDDVDEAEAEDK